MAVLDSSSETRAAHMQLLEKYYKAFNAGDMPTFYSCLNSEVIHDINEGKSEVGIPAFQKFMERMNTCYKEELHNIHIMSDNAGEYLSARFVVHGTYLKTDAGLPEARSQKYILPAGAFFEIKNNKIGRITMFYNLADWLNQVK
ncbi:MAG: nuclear transport factor 2 family protein [Bdellovibrionota bacterium]